jgi:hypothetical protein
MTKISQKGTVENGNLEPGALKLNGARHYLGDISVSTMHRLIKRGLVKPNRATRHLLFSIKELDRFLNA